MIKRFLEDRIVNILQHFPAAAILGPRQSGKTTLAKMIRERLDKESFYLDLENPDDLALLSEPMRFFQANVDKCIIIDEIQRKKELFPILRSAIDQDRRPGRFILLGSASLDLLFLSNETLAGRVIYTELTPFNFNEIKSIKSITDQWLHGSFPEPFFLTDQKNRYEWYRSFFMTYIERDFRMLGLGAAPENLSRFFSMMAHIHGNLLNKNTLANSLAINQVTVNTYLSYFKQAFLVREIPAWHQNIGKRLIKTSKIYIRDSGLLHYLLKINDINQALGHPALGFSWEGYVIEQIICCLGDSYDYYFYRTHDGAEADLVIEQSNKPIYTIEIKFSNSPKLIKGFTTAINDLETSENFIIVPEVRQAFALSDKILVQDLKGFLQMFEK
jgi:uncharacterized protein